MKTSSLRVSSIGMLATLVRVIFVSVLAVASLASYAPASCLAKTTSGKAITGLQVGIKPLPHETAFQAIFDRSQLGDGEYSLKVSTLIKAGFVKWAYRQSFRIGSTATRTITPQEPEANSALPAYQVLR